MGAEDALYYHLIVKIAWSIIHKKIITLLCIFYTAFFGTTPRPAGLGVGVVSIFIVETRGVEVPPRPMFYSHEECFGVMYTELCRLEISTAAPSCRWPFEMY